MKNNTTITAIIANAAKEAGIRNDEFYTATIISIENDMLELVLGTEWNKVTCYADMLTGEILGLMAEAKSIDEILCSDFTNAAVSAMRIAA